MNKYWVQYRWDSSGEDEPSDWNTISEFVTTDDLESWWIEESDSRCPHEILQVVKL
ncbi:hypothetical protein VPHG_00185 [Vibrio phage 11895-B1]|uniref:hypothetical protein n=1 Tax=Vibrio phage 11895-B1 TaxID=754075 RepID=UPI0002C0D5B6|nr:hypothetical protein VPHG_00185 [Vibrio phage 11895-B1]AGH32248.1 hypothetical protein VPHG_00185 [Vibrio phage 11895-B1]